MTRAIDQEGEWVLLSVAVARMAELHPSYATYTGCARRDLDRAIQAGRVNLRGCWSGTPNSPPTSIDAPIADRLDPLRNVMIIRRPSGDIIYRNVQVEWTHFAQYILDHATSWFIQFRNDRFGTLSHSAASADSKGGDGAHAMCARDEAIKKRLSEGVRPGQDGQWPWKTFCDVIRDEADGWIGSRGPRPNKGFSDRSIKRAVAKLQEDK
jgi:hypothetical protein